MKNTFFKRAFLAIGVTASIVSLSVSALAAVNSQSYESKNEYYTQVVSPSEDAYVYQKYPNVYDNEETYVIMNSKYTRNGSNFSLTGIYCAYPFLVTVGDVKKDPTIRYAKVAAFTGNGQTIVSNEQTATVNDYSVLAQVYNVSYTKLLDQVTFRGDSRIDRYSTATAYCPMDCVLNFKK